MKGFIFDLDGVIADTANAHYQAWKYLSEQLGITIDRDFNEKLKGISRMDSLERILAYGKQQDRYTMGEKEALAEEKNTYYLQLLEQLTPSDLLTGVEEFLVQAHERGIPCAIASASKNAPYILKKLHISDRFVGIVDPDSLSKGKPDPEIYIRAAELLNLSPTETVGFEDAQAGIDGIKKCGMYAVGIINDTTLIGADRLVHRLTELDIDELLAVV